MIRRLLLAIVVLALALVVVPPSVKAFGTWLVVDDPLQQARAVVVLGGQVPFRAMEAAHIYKGGWAHEVWLTKGAISEEDDAIARLGISRPAEYTLSQQVLERLGVPKAAIRTLPERVVNTAEEVKAIAEELQHAGGGRVVLVTSKYHTRRVRVLWHSLVRNGEAVVRYTPDDPYEPDRWWRNTMDATAVVKEWFGLLNAWTGFPLRSER